MEHFFSPILSEHLRSNAHQSQIIEGNADVNHTQTIGGIQSNYWGDISPLGFGTPVLKYLEHTGGISTTTIELRKDILENLSVV